MASKKQIEANRRNAKKSTGPKTEEGKAKSSMNALKHGLTSQRVWLNEEEKADFHEFRLGLLDELEPWGSLETQFVCRIAAQTWRLARVPGIEAELLEKMSYDVVEGEFTSLGEAFHRDINTFDGSLGRLARYEAILDRRLIRLMSEYRKIQADRRRREKQHAEDYAREGLPPHDPDEDSEWALSENLEQIEANPAGVVLEETAAARSSREASQVKRRGRRADPGGEWSKRGGSDGALVAPRWMGAGPRVVRCWR